MNAEPEVSVIISPYNAAPWIAETLDSVLSQTFTNIEVIVVDGGSADRTVEIASSYGSPVRIITPGRCSKSAGKNKGIIAAKGKFIAFVDADDLWLPQKLEYQLQLLREQPDVGWAYTDGYLFEGNTTNNLTTFGRLARLYSGDMVHRLLLNNFIPSPTPLIRREVLGRAGLFDESLLQHEPEDWDLWLRVAACFPVGLVNRPLVRYRLHPDSLMAREEPRLAFEGKASVIDLAAKREVDRLGPLRNRAVANCYTGLAGTYARRGRWAEAQQVYAQAIRLSPLLAKAHLGWTACLSGGWPWRMAFNMRRQLAKLDSCN